MTLRFLLTSVISVLFFTNSYGQTPPLSDDAKLFRNDKIEMEGDKRIKKLEEKYIRINESSKSLDGYRIQLFSSSGADSWSQSTEVQSEFLKIYPDIEAYVVHIKPSFKVRIGDYRNRIDAERFYVEIRENFPDAFIVRDKIKFPVLAIEKTDD